MIITIKADFIQNINQEWLMVTFWQHNISIFVIVEDVSFAVTVTTKRPKGIILKHE